MRKLGAALGLVACCLAIGTAKAQSFSLGGDGPSALAVGAGAFDMIDGRKTAGLFRGEYRFGQQFFYLHPMLGAEVTTDGGAYAYGGLGIDIDFGPHWVLTPNAAVGAFDHGNGTHLGSTVEFRTGAEFDYRFDDQTRLGLTFHHISNAGITKQNPGEEEMTVTYALPLSGMIKP
jgi:hypothetical protein